MMGFRLIPFPTNAASPLALAMPGGHAATVGVLTFCFGHFGFVFGSDRPTNTRH